MTVALAPVLRRLSLAVTCGLGLATLAGCNQHPVQGVEYDSEQVCSDDVSVPVVRPKVMLVLDKSGSMAQETWDHDGDPATPEITRWNSLHGTVQSLVDSHGARLDLGATLFPTKDAGSVVTSACLAPEAADVPVGPDTGAQIMSLLPGPDSEVQGGTPATAGIQVAMDHLSEISAEDPKIILFVTDGAANCMEGLDPLDSQLTYDENLPITVAEAYDQHGITTFVVGIDIVNEVVALPEANPFEKLNEVAQAGGAPVEGEASFYDVRDEEALRASMDEILNGLGCELALEEEAQDPNAALVKVDGSLREEVTDCDGEDGWQWVEGAEGTDFRLCGQACTDYQVTGSLQVDFLCQ